MNSLEPVQGEAVKKALEDQPFFVTQKKLGAHIRLKYGVKNPLSSLNNYMAMVYPSVSKRTQGINPRARGGNAYTFSEALAVCFLLEMKSRGVPLSCLRAPVEKILRYLPKSVGVDLYVQWQDDYCILSCKSTFAMFCYPIGILSQEIRECLFEGRV